MPAISVIVPVYNVEKYLRRCVDSILAQTFTDFELILVDDGSPDGCGAICEEYAARDGRVRVLHKRNAGVSSARNAGIDVATGEYVMFCDSDDWVNPRWCEIMYYYCLRYPSKAVVCSIKRMESDTVVQVDNVRIQFVDYFQLYNYGFSASVVNKIFERNILERNRIRFDESIFIAEDLMFGSNYFQQKESEICLICNELYYYYTNPDSATHKYYQNLLELNLKAFSSRLPLVREHLTEYCDIWVSFIISMLDSAFDSRNNKSFFEKIHYNQKMLNSDEVRYCFKHASWKNESPIIKRLLIMHNYYLFFAFQKVDQLKRKIEKKL